MLKKSFFFFLVLAINLCADNSSLSFLNLNVDAITQSMAGASIASINKINALTYNPAGLAEINQNQLIMTNSDYLKNIRQGYFAYGSAVELFSLRWGMSLNYFDLGKYDETQIEETSPGVFEPVSFYTKQATAYCISFGLAKKYFKHLNIGGRSKIIRLYYGENPHISFAIDGGIQLKDFFKNIDLGISFQNFGTRMKYISQKEKLPLKLNLGIAYRIEKIMKVEMAATKVNTEGWIIANGIDVKIWKNLHLRSGFSTSAVEGDNISFGVGFEKKDWSLDYAFQSYAGLGVRSTFSFYYKFGEYLSPHNYFVLNLKNKKDLKKEIISEEDILKYLSETLGITLLKTKQYKNAITSYKNYLYLYPTNKKSIFGLSYSYYKLKNINESLFFLRKCFTLDQNNPLIIQFILKEYIETGYYKYAINFCNNLINNKINYPVLYFYLSLSHYLNGDLVNFGANSEILKNQDLKLYNKLLKKTGFKK